MSPKCVRSSTAEGGTGCHVEYIPSFQADKACYPSRVYETGRDLYETALPLMPQLIV